MNVVDTLLVGMIERWPTLRQTRNDALYDLAEKTAEYGDEIEWDADGNIAFSKNNRGEFGYSLREDLQTKEDELRAKRNLEDKTPGTVAYRVAEQMLASDILFARREHAKEEFTRSNADLIVQSHDHAFGNTLPGSNAFRFFETVIPENANPLWIEAFVGLANDILHFNYKASKFEGMALDYAARYQSDLETAKQKAKAFLIRIKGSDTEKRDLAKAAIEAEITKLRQRAEAAGITLEATLA
jgi:hypothetical protein